MVVYRKTVFSIEDSELTSVGWTAGERWNGWACPRFEKEEADKVMKDYNTDGQEPKAYYDEEKDTYFFPDVWGKDVEWDEYKGIVINTFEGPKTVYAIGAGFWVWDDLSTCNEQVNNGVLLKEEGK